MTGFNHELLAQLIRQEKKRARKKENRTKTLDEISGEIGISKSTLNNLMKPKANPTVETITKLAEYFNISPDLFLLPNSDTASMALVATRIAEEISDPQELLHALGSMRNVLRIIEETERTTANT